MPNKMQVNLDPKTLKPILCTKCGEPWFTSIIEFRKIPRIAIAQPKDLDQPFPAYKCINCGHIKPTIPKYEEKDKIIL